MTDQDRCNICGRPFGTDLYTCVSPGGSECMATALVAKEAEIHTLKGLLHKTTQALICTFYQTGDGVPTPRGLVELVAEIEGEMGDWAPPESD